MLPVIHVHSPCYNEEAILPYFLEHYRFAQKIFIYDNYSVDRSIGIVTENPKVEVISIDTNNQFLEASLSNIKNHGWKQSRGEADWVIVCDIDEFLYYPDWERLFRELKEAMATIAKPVGYHMISLDFPRDYSKPITQQVNRGHPSVTYSKQVLFKPDAITEIRYETGAHIAEPLGSVSYFQSPDLKVLHYKSLGWEYLNHKIMQNRVRLNQAEVDQKNNWHLLLDEETRYRWFCNALIDSHVVVETVPIKREDFDEVYYLKFNQDVANSVSRMEFKSGYDHYVAHGLSEKRLFRKLDRSSQ